MAAFQRKYDPAQVRAIIGSALDHGLSARQVCEAASSGNLPGSWQSTIPFEIPIATARSYIGEERRRRRAIELAGQAPAVALDRAIGEMVSMLDREIDKAKVRQSRDRLKPQELRELGAATREIARTVRDVRAMGGAGGTAATPPAEKGVRHEVDRDDFIGALIQNGVQNGAKTGRATVADRASEAEQDRAEDTEPQGRTEGERDGEADAVQDTVQDEGEVEAEAEAGLTGWAPLETSGEAALVRVGRVADGAASWGVEPQDVAE